VNAFDFALIPKFISAQDHTTEHLWCKEIMGEGRVGEDGVVEVSVVVVVTTNVPSNHCAYVHAHKL